MGKKPPPIVRLISWLVGRPRAVRRFFTEAPDDTPIAETLAEASRSRESFLETLEGFGAHLMALRRHLFRSLIALVLTTALSFAFSRQLMGLLVVPLAGESIYTVPAANPAEFVGNLIALGEEELGNLQVIEPTEAIGVFMKVSLLAGFVLAMPWLVMELYLFIAPGLMPRTRIAFLAIIPVASLLFLAGIGFTYFVMLPAAVPFLYNFMGFHAAWRPSAYFDFVTNIMFWIGAAFQMPLVVYALAAAGLVRARQLVRMWRVAVIAIAVVAAVITPTVDPVNMLLVMAPMLVLYLLSILAAAVAPGRRGNRKEAPG